MRSLPNNHDFSIVHIMKDGEVRTSIKGLTPPPETGCYEVLRNILEKRERREAKCF